ncbi:MAG: hypothetical protein IJ568_03235 [Bacilli bacterium]|nr:hypothetical protein [Bacilli bacterium]
MEDDNEKKIEKDKNILMILLCVVCIILSVIILMYKSYLFKGNDKTNVSEEKIEENKLDDKFLQELINQIPNSSDNINLEFYSPYQNEITTIDDVPYDVIVATSLSKIDKNTFVPQNKEDYYCYVDDGECDYYISFEDLKNNISLLYDISDEITLDKNYIDGINGERCYLYDGNYGCTHNIKYSTFNGDIGSDHHRIYDYSVVANRLFIYEDYFNIRYYIAESESLISFEVYKYSNQNTLMVNKEFMLKDYLSKKLDYDDILFDELSDNLTKFKHTFIKDDNGNYKWVSTEPVL